MRAPLPVALIAIAAIATPVSAAETPGRYTMTPSGDKMVRLDTETGAVSICSKENGDWACAPAAEADKALRAENDRLAAENKKLKDEISQLEDSLGIGPPKPDDEGPSGEPRTKIQLPSEEDLDKAFDYLERMAKKFRERIDRLKERDHDNEGKPL